MQKISLLFIGFIISFILFTPDSLKAQSSCPEPLLITEIQSGTPSNFRHEFIELYNCSPEAVSLQDYQLIFQDQKDQEILNFPLQGNLEAREFLWVGQASYYEQNKTAIPAPVLPLAPEVASLNVLPAEGGTVSLVFHAKTLHKVTYGHKATMAPVPPSGQSIKRCSGNAGFMQTDNNAQDFVVTPLPTLSFLAKMGPACKGQDPELPPADPSPADCQKIIISEILPNPPGIDKGQEFIELHNPTDQSINVQGCSLRLGDGGNPYIFPNQIVEAGEYRAFYETQTAIALPNKTAQTVWLIDQDHEQGIRYGDNLEEGQSWSLLDGWGVGLPTPNEPNQQPETDAGKGAAIDNEACPEGKERNPITNRCRTPLGVGDESPTPCSTGQARNPETGRCRMIATARQSTLTPCEPGQERNPATNRCRTVVSTTTETLQPCAEGQERNPQTNRCRKVPAVASVPHIEDKQSPPVADPKWWFIGLIIAGLLGYGVYEWRHEIRKAWQKLKHKFAKY